MKKDAYYFSHDSNSKDDPKCVMLIEQLGLEGYGIFWVLVETLRDQPNYKYPLSLLPAIARRYNSTAQKVETVVKNYDLFQFTEDEFFFSMSLMDRMQYLESSRLKKSIAGKKGNEIRWNNRIAIAEQSQCDNNAIASPSQIIASKVKESKVKISKVKESKEKVKSFLSDSDEYRLSSYLYKFIKYNNPQAKQPNMQKWSKTFDLIKRIDKRNIDDIKKVIEFSEKDQFWYKNILSPDKLRQHFEKLTLQMQEPKYSKGPGKNTWTDNCEQRTNSIDDLEKKLLGWDK